MSFWMFWKSGRIFTRSPIWRRIFCGSTLINGKPFDDPRVEKGAKALAIDIGSASPSG